MPDIPKQIIFILTTKEFKRILISAFIGFTIQQLCIEYFKKHPELIIDPGTENLVDKKRDHKKTNREKTNKDDKIQPRWIPIFRGGYVNVVVNGVNLAVTIGTVALNVLAEKGLVIGLSLGGFSQLFIHRKAVNILQATPYYYLPPKNCKHSKLKGREVYQIVFPIIDFLRFIGRDEKSHYQRTKMLKVIRSFQTLDPILEKLSNNFLK